jgi:ubiquitin carboxyl-terminal hydrolase 34
MSFRMSILILNVFTTGTAEGGHYYSFIRDHSNQNEHNQDKWFLFNDAEIKQFDPQQLASECFGGETTSKTYDSSADRFMDLSFEKTHSAYMLFYERKERCQAAPVPRSATDQVKPNELISWIWQDNMHFVNDRFMYDHLYFNFVWQICDYVPRTYKQQHAANEATANNFILLATQLACSFILDTYIHAREKPTMLQWIELLTKYFNTNKTACLWFLNHMSSSSLWFSKVFLRCSNSTIRQMFQRLLIHVITRIKLFNNEPSVDCHSAADCSTSLIGRQSPLAATQAASH